eukprot:403365609
MTIHASNVNKNLFFMTTRQCKCKMRWALTKKATFSISLIIEEHFFYFEGVSWFFLQNEKYARETLNKTLNLRSTSAFSQVFAILFYQIFLDHRKYANIGVAGGQASKKDAEDIKDQDDKTKANLHITAGGGISQEQETYGNQIQQEEGTHKTMIFLMKGVERLFEDDVKHENHTFKVVFDQLKQFVFESKFFLKSEACSSMFDDIIMMFCKYFLYYYEESLDNNTLDTGRGSLLQPKEYKFEKILQEIYKLADVYYKYFESTMTEEERAQKEIEYSYIMLHIHRNPNVAKRRKQSRQHQLIARRTLQITDENLNEEEQKQEQIQIEVKKDNSQNQQKQDYGYDQDRNVQEQEQDEQMVQMQAQSRERKKEEARDANELEYKNKQKELKFQARVICIDILISETLKLMRIMQQQEPLLKLMQKFVLLKDLPYMSKVTQNKILNCFNDFSHPGGPYFPPRQVRQYAIKVMSVMFPEGKKARKLVHNFFRLLHPYYWSQSVAYHSLSYTKQTLGYVKSKVDGVLDTVFCRRSREQDQDIATDEQRDKKDM